MLLRHLLALGLLAVFLAAPLLAQPLRLPEGASSLTKSDGLASQTVAMLNAWESEHQLDRPLLDALLLAEYASAADAAVVQQWLRSVFADLDGKIRPRHSVQKKARTIHRHLHREVLQTYEEGATLADVAQQGAYTVPLAAILFKLLADRYEVPVQLRFAQVYIYATLMDEGEVLRVEVFDADHGLEVERHEDDIASALEAHGVLNPYVYDAAGLDPTLTPLEAYRIVTSTSRPLSDAQLVGVYFGGATARFMADDRFEEALEASERALRFFPDEEIYQQGHTVALLVMAQQCGDERAADFVPTLRDAMAFRAGDPVFIELLPMMVRTTTSGLLNASRDYETARALVLDARGSGGLTDEARAQYDEIEARTYQLEASTAYLRGDLDTAQAAIVEARRLQPDDIGMEEHYVSLVCDITMQRIQRGHFDEAEALLTPLLDLVDRYPVVSDRMARVLVARVVSNDAKLLEDDPEAARQLLLRARDYGPDLVFVAEILARVYHEEAMQLVRDGDYPAALVKAQEGLDAVPGSKLLLDDIDAIEPYVD